MLSVPYDETALVTSSEPSRLKVTNPGEFEAVAPGAADLIIEPGTHHCPSPCIVFRVHIADSEATASP